jgi:hypothetical protein
MPVEVKNPVDLKPGDLYEDSLRHPCLCVNKKGSEISGISLVDGSYPRTDDLEHSRLRKLSVDEAWHWRISGPRDVELSPQQRWWETKPAYLINPASYLENLYFFSLYQVEWNQRALERLGAPIRHEWHNISSSIDDQGSTGKAQISFKVYGQEKAGKVHVTAHKTVKDWLFDDLSLDIEGDSTPLHLIQNGIDVSSS